MRVLGVNKGTTNFGKVVRMGGSALVEDGRVVAAIAEERTTREKHAAGFSASSSMVLAGAGITMDDVDVIAVSTCCETEMDALVGHGLAGDPRLVSVGHHLSPAALAFYGSGFARPLVGVFASVGIGHSSSAA